MVAVPSRGGDLDRGGLVHRVGEVDVKVIGPPSSAPLASARIENTAVSSLVIVPVPRGAGGGEAAVAAAGGPQGDGEGLVGLDLVVGGRADAEGGRGLPGGEVDHEIRQRRVVAVGRGGRAVAGGDLDRGGLVHRVGEVDREGDRAAVLGPGWRRRGSRTRPSRRW